MINVWSVKFVTKVFPQKLKHNWKKNHLKSKHPQEYDLVLKEVAAKKSTDEILGTSFQMVKGEFKQKII